MLEDLAALEALIARQGIESGERRIGAEQEVFLVDRTWRPAPLAMELLAALDDDHFTTELAQFNLEFNLDPLALTGEVFTQLEQDVDRYLQKLRRVAQEHAAEVVLVGILPTLTDEHLSLDFMTPKPRYRALNDAMLAMRGEQFRFRIKGRDELMIQHGNVMPEACNTSFQVHYQVSADEFAAKYNIAQLVTAPILAAATNSPLLLGRQLWHETRIALFQQATDARRLEAGHRQSQARVSFGSRWLESTVTEIFRDDIARFRVLLGEDEEENALAMVAAGEAPQLHALRQHNGTVYRWNRPCYGVAGGVAHLRIENRVLPAGPTVVDEVANAAFWVGLLEAGDSAFGDIPARMPFDAARGNFLATARKGLATEVHWLDARRLPVRELILKELLPVAHQGLEALGIRDRDRQRYLGIIEERVASGQTGSRWLRDFADSLAASSGPNRSLAPLVAGVHRRQVEGAPCHTWDGRRTRGPLPTAGDYTQVRDLMSTDLITIGPNDPVELAASIMRWRRIRHIPVEDRGHRLLGLVSERSLLRQIAAPNRSQSAPTLVRDVMSGELVTVTPETSIQHAIAVMRAHRVSCLPVVNAEGLPVGILSERDVIVIAAPLLDAFLADGPGRDGGTDEEQ